MPYRNWWFALYLNVNSPPPYIATYSLDSVVIVLLYTFDYWVVRRISDFFTSRTLLLSKPISVFLSGTCIELDRGWTRREANSWSSEHHEKSAAENFAITAIDIIRKHIRKALPSDLLWGTTKYCHNFWNSFNDCLLSKTVNADLCYYKWKHVKRLMCMPCSIYRPRFSTYRTWGTIFKWFCCSESHRFKLSRHFLS